MINDMEFESAKSSASNWLDRLHRPVVTKLDMDSAELDSRNDIFETRNYKTIDISANANQNLFAVEDLDADLEKIKLIRKMANVDFLNI
eukprot:CAMPEP_0116932014 /NCGR_PEP_ID=MMETSP0467-20121206/28169_1 /TAXON_ID=283647 /ORGANISM="Mesodinium pulex, Strain SPMC105" /LENGTH=88 /DNA_ID=CAMNT_0004612583 /DNA_START=332 /DNA_END=598 /DNA_ORIENTATION=+